MQVRTVEQPVSLLVFPYILRMFKAGHASQKLDTGPKAEKVSPPRAGPSTKSDDNSSFNMVVLTILAALVALIGVEYAGALGNTLGLHVTEQELPAQSVVRREAIVR